jgi:ParB family chromosome partitioning protein
VNGQGVDEACPLFHVKQVGCSLVTASSAGIMPAITIRHPFSRRNPVAKQPKRLGRGIASLLGDAGAIPAAAASDAPGTVAMTRELPVQSIVPNPMQPRSDSDPQRLDELTNSIRTSGVIQPVVVRLHGGTYELIAGQRRWRAAQQAGLQTIPAVVRDATEQQMIEFALIENIQREDLNPIDRALAYRQCCQRFEIRAEELAEHLGEDRSTVANYIRLLDLPESVQSLVRDESLSMGHARALLGVGDQASIERLARDTVANGFSVRYLEGLVRKHKDRPGQAAPPGPAKAPTKLPLIQDLEQRFTDALQTRVTITQGRKKHTGKILIEYYTLDDFDRIAERLGVDLQDV